MKLTSIRTAAVMAATGATVFAVLTGGAAIAGADSKDDQFVASLKNLGITERPDIARGIGLMICGDLGSGRTPDQIAKDFEQHGPEIVAAAKKAYCP
jgi:acetylornithine/succinyldiaminopimelate/putrescine aminotransferase